ncbi:MAG: multicopper oxidase domain-containing protein [Syntrophobacteria bacterium]
MEIEFLADNPSEWFHHCHNLYYMEAGMANVVQL